MWYGEAVLSSIICRCRTVFLSPMLAIGMTACAPGEGTARNDASVPSHAAPASTSPSTSQVSTSPSRASTPGMFEHHGVVEVDSPTGALRFRVELALTDAERARGLMERTHLDDDAGMLFIFPRERIQSFWMKNTLIPLDMIFIGADGVIAGVVESAEPLTLTSRTVDRPSRYVLELRGGAARERGITAGTRVRFEGVPSELVDPRALSRASPPSLPSHPPLPSPAGAHAP